MHRHMIGRIKKDCVGYIAFIKENKTILDSFNIRFELSNKKILMKNKCSGSKFYAIDDNISCIGNLFISTCSSERVCITYIKNGFILINCYL